MDVPKDMLKKTHQYADSVKYMSWEEYYTDLLFQKTRDTVYKYKKSKLASAYKTETALTKVLSVIPNKIIPNNSFNNKRENDEEK